MRRLVQALVIAASLSVLSGAAYAQFGHPLKGQWSGEWTSRSQANRLLLTLDWDGKAITGLINPGPNAATVKSVTFDYTNPSAWGVKVTAEGKDASGKVVSISIDGKLENIGAYRRLFHGTWVQDGQKGEFALTRN
ncbi:MAG TPA: hypothetical protein VIY56_13995 [Vicinamibacterales bacterium]